MVDCINYTKLKEEAVHVFYNGFACSESVIHALRKVLELDIPDDAIAMSTGFPWGLGGAGCLCGAVAGATMCLGFLFGRREPNDPIIGRCHQLTKEFADNFNEKFGACCCGRLIASYEDRNSPERKDFCRGLVEFAVCDAARIIAREFNIPTQE